MKKVDANQKEVVAKLRKIGASVVSTAAIGKGMCDIIVGYKGVNYLFEIKDGAKPPSQRKLTPDEAVFHDKWEGRISIINNIDEALKLIGYEE